MEEVVLGKAEETADVSALMGPQEGLNALLAPVRSAKGPLSEPLPSPFMLVNDRIGQLVAASSIGVCGEDALQIDHHKMLLGLDVGEVGEGLGEVAILAVAVRTRVGG